MYAVIDGSSSNSCKANVCNCWWYLVSVQSSPLNSRGKIEREDPGSEVSHVWLVTVFRTFEFDWLYPSCLVSQHNVFMNNMHVYCLPLLVSFSQASTQQRNQENRCQSFCWTPWAEIIVSPLL